MCALLRFASVARRLLAHRLFALRPRVKRRLPLVRHALAVVGLFTLVSGAAAPDARADWNEDPLVNVAVSLANGTKEDLFAVSDGAGGMIAVWEDKRTGTADIYAQRIDVNGSALWSTDGVPVCSAPGAQGLYHSSTGTTGFTPIVADGDGGVWIVWQDERAFSTLQRDIYLQHLDADGRRRFAANGIAVAARAGMEDQPTLVADGAGGVIVVWQDRTADPIFTDLHGQRVAADGTMLWNGGEPRPLVVLDWDQDGPSLCADGAGGAFLAWSDARDDVGDVYAQRLDAMGNGLWGVNGIAVAVQEDGQDAITMQLASDGEPVLAWVDRRTGTPDIYAQKLNAATGAPRWTAGGRAVCTAVESQYRPALAPDGTGGAYVAWFDYRVASGPPWDLNIYAQRILADGSVAWIVNGVAVCTAPDAQRDVDVASDGAGGLFLAWEDNRNGTGREDIYAQHLGLDGAGSFAVNGIALCLVGGNQTRPDLVAGASGMIAAWPDDRVVLYENDIYCDRARLGTAAELGVNRVVFDFGEPAQAVSDTFRVSNVGGGVVTVSSIGLEAPSGSFTVRPLQATPIALEPGSWVDVEVTFDPLARTGVPVTNLVLIEHDAPRPPSPAVVQLRGESAAASAPEETSPSAELRLHVWPVPFSLSSGPAVTIAWQGAAAAGGALTIHDVAGRLVRRWVDLPASADGRRTLRWDRRDGEGRTLPAGVYYLRLRVKGQSAVRTAMLLR